MYEFKLVGRYPSEVLESDVTLHVAPELPAVVDFKVLDGWKIAEIALTIACLMPCVLLAYAMAAARARKFFTGTSSIRFVNRATAVVMAAWMMP